MDLKKKKKQHFRQDRHRNNQKYGELVVLCFFLGGGGSRAYFCLGPFLQISELWTVTRLTDRIKKRLPG